MMIGSEVNQFRSDFSGISETECFTPKWLDNNKDEWGYVRVPSGKQRYTRGHRMAYRLFCGDLKPGEWVLHSCGNPGCINPYHLRIGSAQDNADDAKRHGTTAREFRLPKTKLSDQDVREIRASSLRNYELCKIYAVSKSCISNIRTGKTRKNV